MTRAALALLLFAACSDGVDQAYTIVTVNGRPAVHDARTLRITLSNSGSERTDEIAFAGQFPFTFSVSAPERAGDLGIRIDALDNAGFVVGRGNGAAQVDDPAASVMLDTTDFVVNTDFAGDQYPSNDSEANGLQVAAAADGTWTVAFLNDCDDCQILGRRFDPSGRPVTTQIAAGTNAFSVSTSLTTFTSVPAIASAGSSTVELWDYSEPSPSTRDGVACRSLDAQGAPNAAQVEISQDPFADVVSVSPLSNSNFAVAWRSIDATTAVRGAIIRGNCTIVNAAVNVSTIATPTRPVVTGHPTLTSIMYAWLVSGSVHVRLANLNNAFTTADTEFLPVSANEVVEAVRVAPLGNGFAILVRWAQATGFEGPGRIDLYRTNAAGAVQGPAVNVTTKSGTDFGSYESFGVATSPTGTMFVTWHSCNANGDGQGCGVYGRAFDSTGAPITAEFTVPTTTVGDQTKPSVTALPDDAFAVIWRDDSMQAPDTAGSSVRARIVYLDSFE